METNVDSLKNKVLSLQDELELKSAQVESEKARYVALEAQVS